MPSAILTYHSIDTSQSPISISPDLFRQQLDLLAESSIRVVPLVDVRRSTGGVAITFDDGFANFTEYALPLLAEYEFPATVFVVTGYCGRRNDWSHAGYSGIPSLNLMGWSELCEAARAGVELGAHTVRHMDLTAMPPEEALVEMTACREELENRTGSPVRSFAYPYGASNNEVRNLAREKFNCACGTDLRFVTNSDSDDNFPRLDVHYLRDLARFRSAVVEGTAGYITIRRMLREVRRIL